MMRDYGSPKEITLHSKTAVKFFPPAYPGNQKRTANMCSDASQVGKDRSEIALTSPS